MNIEGKYDQADSLTGPRELPVPEDSGPKEAYAFFGLVSYLGQVLEKGLVNMAVILQLRGIGSITRQFVDELFESMEARTFGELLRTAREIVPIPESLDKELEEALRKRNYLAHHFFADHSEDFFSDAGRRQMIDELREIGRLFSGTDRALDKIYLPLWERLGITKEVVDAELEAIRARASARDDQKGDK